MSTDLQSIVLERERALYPGKNLGSTSGMNITEFMTDKMTDMGKARSEKVIRLEFKIKQVIVNYFNHHSTHLTPLSFFFV
jgi:sorting nexin-4